MNGTLSLLIYAAMLGALAVGTVRKPPVAVAGVLCLFGLKQWAQSMPTGLASYPLLTNYTVAGIVVLALVVRMLRGHCLFCRISPIHVTALALYLYSALSLVWTPDLPRALEVWQHDLPYIVTAVVLAPLLVKDRDDLDVALYWVMLLGATVLALLLVFGNWGARGLVAGHGALQDETNPLALAGLAGSVACAAMFTQSRRIRAVGWLLRLAIVAVSLLVMIRSGSRGQLVAVLLAVPLALPIVYRRFRLGGLAAMLVAAVVIGATVAYGFGEYVQWFDARWSESTALSDAQGRYAMVEALLQAWAEGGITVLTGLGNSAAFSPAIAGFYPHNVPLEVLGEEGLVGIVLYVALLMQSLSAIRAARVSMGDDRVARGVLAATSASLAFFFFVSLKEGNMIGSVYFFLYAISLGTLARAPSGATTQDAGAFRRAPRLTFPNVMR